MRLDDQPGLGLGIVDVAEHVVKRTQWTARPRFADFAEQPVFDRVPLRGAGGIMTNGDRQPQPIGQFLLKLLFEDPAARSVRATAIGFNEQVGCTGKALGSSV
jgi:hypothetical protein